MSGWSSSNGVHRSLTARKQMKKSTIEYEVVVTTTVRPLMLPIPCHSCCQRPHAQGVASHHHDTDVLFSTPHYPRCYQIHTLPEGPHSVRGYFLRRWMQDCLVDTASVIPGNGGGLWNGPGGKIVFKETVEMKNCGERVREIKAVVKSSDDTGRTELKEDRVCSIACKKLVE